jgi:PhzF family phenazine biosynthesis protein
MAVNAPFYLINAFTDKLYGGNPAAVLLLTREENAKLTDERRLALSATLAQPMTMYTVPREGSPTTFDVRWFTGVRESPICGHATLACGGLLFFKPELGLVPPDAKKITFETAFGETLYALKREEGKVELELENARVDSLKDDEERTQKLRKALASALDSSVQITQLSAGNDLYVRYCLIEITGTDLSKLEVNVPALVSLAYISSSIGG